jgi:hypothetical protein
MTTPPIRNIFYFLVTVSSKLKWLSFDDKLLRFEAWSTANLLIPTSKVMMIFWNSLFDPLGKIYKN